MKTLPICVLFLSLAACGDDTSSSLNEAANQSDPAAAAVLRNEAAAADANGSEGSLSDPNSSAQQALQNAGDAAVAAPDGSNTATAAPVTGAKPHAANDPVPPPQVAPKD